MSVTRLTVPGDVPSKSNSYGTNKFGGFYKKPAVKEFEKRFAAASRGVALYRYGDSGEEIFVVLKVTYKDRRRDLDNASKAVLDACQDCGLICNDRYVTRIYLERDTDKNAPKLDIVITDELETFKREIQ